MSLLDIVFKSFTDFTLCSICRHRFFVLWYGFSGAPRWYQAGIWSFRLPDNFSGAKLTLCLQAITNMFVIDFGR